jgi:hypothetical protein
VARYGGDRNAQLQQIKDLADTLVSIEFDNPNMTAKDIVNWWFDRIAAGEEDYPYYGFDSHDVLLLEEFISERL